MPTPLITSFSINTNAPIDSRMVASTSTDRNAISYKYDGMQVFTLDSRTMWTYNASTLSWTASTGGGGGGNGIYGGSGALLANTYVNTGTIANSISAQSYNFVLGSSASTNSIYYSTIFNRHTATGDYTGVEVKNQWSYNSNTSSVAYVSYNPPDPINGYVGGIDFVTSNTRRVTINKNGVFRLWSPTFSADIIAASISSNQIYYLPNKTGNIALISDIPNGLHKLTNLGNTTSNNIIISGTLSVGYLQSLTTAATSMTLDGSTNQVILSPSMALTRSSNGNIRREKLVSGTIPHSTTGGVFVPNVYTFNHFDEVLSPAYTGSTGYRIVTIKYEVETSTHPVAPLSFGVTYPLYYRITSGIISYGMYGYLTPTLLLNTISSDIVYKLTSGAGTPVVVSSAPGAANTFVGPLTWPADVYSIILNQTIESSYYDGAYKCFYTLDVQYITL